MSMFEGEPVGGQVLTAEVDGQSVEMSVRMIGPGEAHKLLAINDNNRPERDTAQKRYTADMKSGDWQFTGEPVRVSHEPLTLLDGQNRLQSIIASGVTLPILVIEGLDHCTQDEMDGSVKRTLADTLSMRGETSAHVLASMIRLIGLWESGHRRNLGKRDRSNAECLRTYKAHPEIRDYVNRAASASSAYGLTTSAAGLLWWVFAHVDEESEKDAEVFFESLVKGSGLEEGDPILVLREQLRKDRDRNNKSGSSSAAERQIALTIKAWNAWRRGDTISVLRWVPGGATREPMPEPI